MILSMIQASALLHQRQRDSDNFGRLIATAADYDLAARLLDTPLGRALGETLLAPALRFYEKVLAEVEDPIDPLPVPFTAAIVRQRLPVGRSTISGFLSELEDKGLLEFAEVQSAGGAGRRERGGLRAAPRPMRPFCQPAVSFSRADSRSRTEKSRPGCLLRSISRPFGHPAEIGERAETPGCHQFHRFMADFRQSAGERENRGRLNFADSELGSLVFYHAAPVNAHDYQSAVSELTFGKRLPTATYVYAPTCDDLPPRLAALISDLRTRLSLAECVNVLKLGTDFSLSFLRYPTFLQDPHPMLAESIRVNLATGKAKRILYEGHANPPILHRKECFLPPTHPDIPRFARLTKQEEDAGLFANPRSIGFRANWDKLLRSKNLAYADHELEAVESGQPIPVPATSQPVTVHRYRTAISRTDLSKPIREALTNGLLLDGQTVFDYGCGLGDDACNLHAIGFHVAAWDPAHRPDGEKHAADFVNLGYVLNVIEDPAERVDVLLDAWTFAQRVLLVSTLIEGNELYNSVRHHSDGILTKRDTFQKYFSPAEIQGLIESALDVEAHPVSTGIYAVFRDTRDAQAFLSSRSRRRIDWEQLSRRLGHGRREPRSGASDLYSQHKQLLDEFWTLAIDLGRLPRQGEFERDAELRVLVGSPKKALRIFTDRYGTDTYEAARR